MFFKVIKFVLYIYTFLRGIETISSVNKRCLNTTKRSMHVERCFFFDILRCFYRIDRITFTIIIINEDEELEISKTAIIERLESFVR